jgi:hypothetical protein
MFVISPDPFLMPTYRIGAFVTASIARNSQIDLVWAEYARQYFNERFGENNWLVAKNGREAIAFAMDELKLESTQNISILTPSHNLYISGCVTSTLSGYCNWDRKASEQTAAYFVNHEFGYLYKDMVGLVNTGLPVIEDCCTTFFSQDEPRKIGLYGNYSLFSFPKFFSIQIGGLLVGKGVGSNQNLLNKVSLTSDEINYILKVVGFELRDVNNILQKRNELHQYASAAFESMGFSLRFPNEPGVVPSLLLLNNHQIIKDLPSFKNYLYAQGIQNSVFYGEDAFFIPCHHYLSEVDIEYFKFVTEQYIQLQN